MPEDREKDEYGPITDPKDFLRAKKMDMDVEAQKLALDAETTKMKLEGGWLGRIAGSPKNAPNNIAFLIVTLLLVAGIVVNFVYPHDRVEFWKIILPIFTLTLGYLFGRNSKD